MPKHYLSLALRNARAAPFVFAMNVTTLAICWLAVGSQTLRAARARPAQVLRYE